MQETDLYQLLSLHGERMEGASYADASTLISLEAATSKPHCALHSWIVLDLPSDDSMSPSTRQSGQTDNPSKAAGSAGASETMLLPIVLFSHYVEFHSTGQFQKGDSIRTGLAVNYDGRGIFETQDAIYVLLGQGVRREAPIDLLKALPQGLALQDYSLPNRAEPRRGISALKGDQDVVYCDLQMSPEQGRELISLSEGLRAGGLHPGLESVFLDIAQELSPSSQRQDRRMPKR